MRRAALIAAVTAASLGGAVAVAQAPPLAARVAACETGPDAADRFAVFTGSMPRDGATTMAMRFDLYERLPHRAFERVVLPRWGVWEKTARKGVPGFIFTKRVERLAAPAGFRAVVSFRWLDADGRVLRTARRTSPTCRQPDWRPDLHVEAVIFPAGSGPTRVVVRNRGRTAAGAFAVEGRRDDVMRTAEVQGLPPKEETTIALALGRCRAEQHLTLTVDAGDRVDEAREGDDVKTVACPD
jgi:hypothetical protein